MKNMSIESIPVSVALEKRGFTYYDGQEPCYIAKVRKNTYAVVDMNYEAQMWTVNEDITDDEFIRQMTGSESDFDDLCDKSRYQEMPLFWALGFTED